jgi:cysteine desulfurase/selenocysteine lyase
MKKEFPLLGAKIAYLDNAATTQKPKVVIDRIKKFYENENANAHSGIYGISEKVSASIENARKEFAELINAKEEEIIFTRNATDSFNIIAEMLEKGTKKQDNIVISEIEHHSNFIPWQQLAKRMKCELRIAKYDEAKEEINPETLVDKNTRIVSFTMMSNVTGLIVDAEKIISRIKKKKQAYNNNTGCNTSSSSCENRCKKS